MLLDGPVKAGRRDSMLEVEGPAWLLEEFDAMGRDLPRFKFDGFMIGPEADKMIQSVVGMRGRSSGYRRCYMKLEGRLVLSLPVVSEVVVSR